MQDSLSSLEDIYVAPPADARYYIIGSKYGNLRQEDKFPEIYRQGRISVGFAEGTDLSEYVGCTKDQLRAHVEDASPSALSQLHRFLNIKPGDVIAVKASGSPKGGKAFLSIVGLAEVLDQDPYYRYDPGRLEHTLPVRWLTPYNNYVKTYTLGYGQTVHQLSNPSHIHDIFGQQLQLPAVFTSSTAIAMSKNIPLNQILYGPPGTGKTYATLQLALECMGEQIPDREEARSRFQELVAQGRIAFTTFHQSMSYEDFIEGIKPAVAEEGEPISYQVQEGIFRQMCIKAAYSIWEQRNPQQRQQAADFSSLYDAYIEHLEERLTQEGKVLLSTRTKGRVPVESISEKGAIFFRPEGSSRGYRVSKPRMAKLYQYISSPEHVSNINETCRTAIGGCNATVYWATLMDFRAFSERYQQSQQDTEQHDETIWEEVARKKEIVRDLSPQDYEQVQGDPHVLIIDEINRGNVSQIFGELITLLEEDKRLGREEALEVILPYSKERFGVPANLYVIGTMNTADRSVEALDTALRRRFSFTHMPPRPELLQDVQVQGIGMEDLLRMLNTRIEYLLDKDHLIGHSYLLPLKQRPEVALLKDIFQQKIIPLLQEYFFGDEGKVGLVLGDDFFEPQSQQQDIFAPFGRYDTAMLSDRPVYHLKPLHAMSDADFLKALNTLMGK